MAAGAPEGKPHAPAGDDSVLPFQIVRAGAIGQIVRLGPLADGILTRHGNPEPVSAILGEALALTALIGSALKFDGKLILQTRTDGPLRFLVVNYEAEKSGDGGRLGGYASYDLDKAGSPPSAPGIEDRQALIGVGHLAMTIDHGPDRARYQGIVPLEKGSLSDAALAYFRRSEQVPTFLRLAHARVYTGARAGEPGTKSEVPGQWHWRIGGLLVQHLDTAAGHGSSDPGADRLPGEDDARWRTVLALSQSVEDHELVDPLLAPEDLLFRLFHEEGVRVQAAKPLAEYCQCSMERVQAMLGSFGASELDGMREADGKVAVTCEFCRAAYRFTLGEIGR